MELESASASRGLDLMWDYAEHECVQGVTELTRRFRCGDEWWNDVLDEIRTLQLSSDNHAFLHGLPTSVAGSWLKGRVACKQTNFVQSCMPRSTSDSCDGVQRKTRQVLTHCVRIRHWV